MAEYPEWGMKACTLDYANANGISYAVKRVERPGGGREIFFVAGVEEPVAVSPSEVAKAIRRKERLVPVLLRSYGRNAEATAAEAAQHVATPAHTHAFDSMRVEGAATAALVHHPAAIGGNPPGFYLLVTWNDGSHKYHPIDDSIVADALDGGANLVETALALQPGLQRDLVMMDPKLRVMFERGEFKDAAGDPPSRPKPPL